MRLTRGRDAGRLADRPRDRARAVAVVRSTATVVNNTTATVVNNTVRSTSAMSSAIEASAVVEASTVRAGHMHSATSAMRTRHVHRSTRGMHTTVASSVVAGGGTDVEELRLGGGGAGDSVANCVLDGVLHLHRNMLHGRLGNGNDCGLHCDGEHLVHLLRDMLNGTLGDAGHCLLDDWVRAEDTEIGLRDDLELHPRDFTEHHRQLLVRLDEDNGIALQTEARAKIKRGRDVLFVMHRVAAVGLKPEVLEVDILARLVEGARVPDETTVDVSNAPLEVEASMGNATVLVVNVTVQESSFKDKVGAEFVEQVLLAEAKRK